MYVSRAKTKVTTKYFPFSFSRYITCDFGNEVFLAVKINKIKIDIHSHIDLIFFIQNELLLHQFHELPWYLMTLEQQLDYANMLNRLQNGAILQMGPFAALNLETLSLVSDIILVLNIIS